LHPSRPAALSDAAALLSASAAAPLAAAPSAAAGRAAALHHALLTLGHAPEPRQQQRAWCGGFQAHPCLLLLLVVVVVVLVGAAVALLLMGSLEHRCSHHLPLPASYTNTIKHTVQLPTMHDYVTCSLNEAWMLA
jgi:hypothetical protein